MIVSDFVARTYLKATGKVSSLTSTDNDWIKILALGNSFKDDWAREPGVNWATRYSPAVSAGTVTATDTFNIPASLYTISSQEGDSIRIIHSDGTTYTDYDLVAPERLKHYSTGNYVAQVGSTLKFNAAFKTTSPQFGGTIYVPGYTIPADMVNGSDTVPVDDPNWLCTIVAAEYVRTDITRQAQYPNLIAQANELMKKMIENNAPQVQTVTLEQVAVGRTF